MAIRLSGFPELAFIDFEASGLDQDSYPISVGISMLHRPETYYSVIRPAAGWTYWSEVSEGIHGLSRSHIEQVGRPATVVADEIMAFIGDAHLMSDNPWHESMWLETLLAVDRKHRPRAFKDLNALLIRLSAGNNIDLGDAIRSNKARHPHTHNAGDDARGMRELTRALLDP